MTAREAIDGWLRPKSQILSYGRNGLLRLSFCHRETQHRDISHTIAPTHTVYTCPRPDVPWGVPAVLFPKAASARANSNRSR